MAQIIDGKKLAHGLLAHIKQELDIGLFARPPCLATVLVGHNAASQVYVANKRKTAQALGIRSVHHELSEQTDETELLKLLAELNHDHSVDAILVQMPLPHHIRESAVIDAIFPTKDVDGFHPKNLGYLLRGDPRVVACTPLGIMHMIKSVGYDLAKKNAVVIGRSTIVGKPVAMLLLNHDATVTICHALTDNLMAHTSKADVVVVAIGRPEFIDAGYIKPGALVVDVGINRLPDKRIVGDVNFASVEPVAGFITKVPGGVGPMTIAMLMNNTLKLFLAAR